MWMMMQCTLSCKKEEVNRYSSLTVPHEVSQDNETRIYSTAKEQTGSMLRDSVNEIILKRTVLGETRENPFTVEQMAAAHRFLYGSDVQAMPTTDLYVKFMPTTEEDILALEATGWIFFDFPLERKVIEMGDYYQTTEEGSYPVLYAVIKPNEAMPQVDYEILNNLYLDMSDPLLVATSLKLTGNESEIDNVIPPIYPGTPPYEALEVPCGEDFECDPDCKVKVVIDDSTWPFTYTCECDCSGDGDGGYFSCCGNVVDPGYPAGCVRVEDTELSTHLDFETYLPVRRVQVVLWNGWFRLETTETDDNGCWVSDKTFNSFYMWIRFKNHRHKIRGFTIHRIQVQISLPLGLGVNFGLPVLGYNNPVTDFVDHFSFPSRDIRVFYDMWASNEQGTRKHLYWGAATVNNANHEMHTYTANDGINSPPNGLDIMVGTSNGDGMTLMNSKQIGRRLISGILLGGIPTRLTPQIQIPSKLPDVYIGIFHFHSDFQKFLSYHELTHASHFTNVTNLYWDLLITAETNAWLASGNPHGNANSTGAGIIAVCESWAEHNGKLYAHRTYGGDHSLNFIASWLELLEQSRNESLNHIPVGYYNDLSDGIDLNEEVGDTFRANRNRGSLRDAVEGFTYAQMFQCLTDLTLNPGIFTDKLIHDFLNTTNNTEADVRALFDEYK